ncbi:MAG TPA: universal stress protein [Prevotellaceae bacterium]|nr:universal stress protein [Prevotellaceae bacterium]
MIQLEKGQNAKLNMDMFYVGLGWDVREDKTSNEDFDLDVCAFMVGANDKVLTDDYFVFYNSQKRLKVVNGQTIKTIVSSSLWFDDNEKMRHESRPTDPEISVIGSIDDEDGATSEDGDDETMDIDLTRVRSDVQKIVICVSIYHAEERHQNFGQVERAYVRLYKQGQADGDGEYIYDLTEDFSACTAVEFCQLYRHNGEWKVKALGNGYKGGLQELLNKYTI